LERREGSPIKERSFFTRGEGRQRRRIASSADLTSIPRAVEGEKKSRNSPLS